MSSTLSDSIPDALSGLVVDLLGDGREGDRPAARGNGFLDLPPERVLPFNALDELCFHLNTDNFAWTIQLEVRAPGPIDERRLRTAVAAAAQRHPMARARLAHYRPTDRRYAWEIMPELPADPVWVARAATDEALAQIRQDVLSSVVPLDQAPPFRVWLVRRGDGRASEERASRQPPGDRGDGDTLLLAASHVATDGMGAMRLLRSIVRAYAGVADPVAPVDPEIGRDLVSLASPGTMVDHVERIVGVGTSLRRSKGRLARIAVDGGEAGAPGFRFHHMRITSAELGTMDLKRHPGATVNDLLLAALHLAISDWNADHAREAERISVMMPMNMRPDDTWHETLGNVSLMAPVSTSPEDRDDAGAIVHAVADQTRRAKRTGSASLLLDLLERSHLLPSVAKKFLPFLSPLSRDVFIDTAVLSNLGRVAEPLDFGEGDHGGVATELWFSPPARMPLGVGVGAATHEGDLFLSFRCCQAQFDAAGAASFAEYFRAALQFVA